MRRVSVSACVATALALASGCGSDRATRGEGTIDVDWHLEPDGRTMRLNVAAPRQVEIDARIPAGYDGSIKMLALGQ